MEFLKKLLKSKTFDANAIIILILTILSAAGVEIPPELGATIVGVFMGIMNIILRMVTTEAITEK